MLERLLAEVQPRCWTRGLDGVVQTEELASCNDHTVDFVFGFVAPTQRTRPKVSWRLGLPLGMGGSVVLLVGLCFL